MSTAPSIMTSSIEMKYNRLVNNKRYPLQLWTALHPWASVLRSVIRIFMLSICTRPPKHNWLQVLMEIAAINIKYTITLFSGHLNKNDIQFKTFKKKNKKICCLWMHWEIVWQGLTLHGINCSWGPLHQKEIYLKQVVESGTIKTLNIEIQNILGKTSCSCNCQMQR